MASLVDELVGVLVEEEKLYSIKFMTKEEYKKNFFFDYNEKTLYYLLKKYIGKHNESKRMDKNL